MALLPAGRWQLLLRPKGGGEKAGAASWERIIVFLPPLAVAVVMSAGILRRE
jgi:hypothetical protein